MALNIRNKEAEALAAEVARRTGETKTEAVITALKERLARVKRLCSGRRLSDDLAEIAQRFDGLPVLNARDPDEILG